MRKCVFALIAVCLLLKPAFTVYADLIYEPDNGFYQQHRRQIVYLGRSFMASGTGGSLSVKKDPGFRNDIAKLQNGEVTYVQYSCLYDGEFWGFTSEFSGWIKLDQMLVMYDYVAFEEDHRDELYPYDGDFSQIKETRSAIAWAWPGSDVYIWTYENLDTENFRVSYAYKDNEGREWGFVTYLYGGRNIWVCLSDPLNRDLPAFNPAPEPIPWVSETTHINIERSGMSLFVLITIFTAVLVVSTVVLINVYWRPNKTNPGGKND